MDKRFELTPKQKKLVDEFQAILDEMEEEKIGFIADYYENGGGLTGFKIYNKEKVKEAGYSESSEDSSGSWDEFGEYGYISHIAHDFEEDIEYEDDEFLYMLYRPNVEELKDLPFPSYTKDDMYVDTEAMDLRETYNDDNQHLVVLLKD
jgi:hypothetical protein